MSYVLTKSLLLFLFLLKIYFYITTKHRETFVGDLDFYKTCKKNIRMRHRVLKRKADEKIEELTWKTRRFIRKRF